MSKSASLLLAVIVASVLSGCLTPDKNMKSWLGHHGSELIASWGAPSTKYPDGQGGEVWVYQSQRTWTAPGHATTTVNGNASSYGNLSGNANYYTGSRTYSGNYQGNTTYSGTATTTYTPPQTSAYNTIRSFFLNSDGVVYRYSWQGL
jgi:hypothetical protein